MAEQWQPKFFDHFEHISQTESWGARARQRWGEKLAWLERAVDENSCLFDSGIGMGISGIKDETGKVIIHKDGSNLPDLGKIMENHGLSVLPAVVFIVASTLTAEHVNAVSGLAREMKENGVQAVIPILTSLAHERQDHKFIDIGRGQKMEQVTTLKDVVESLSRYCDGALWLHPHSHRGVEFGLRFDFPILPIDGLKLLLTKSGYQNIHNLIELGPDAGRQDAARVAADFFNCPLLSVDKVRDRFNMGKPEIIWPLGSREWIRDNNCTVVITDDEIRDAGTTDAIADGLNGYADDVRIVAVKAVMSDEVRSRIMIKDGQLIQVQPENDWVASSAVQKLNKPWIKEILITDAVQPVADLSPIADKIRIVSLRPEIDALVRYLQQHLIPSGQEWLRNTQETGTLLSLDLTVESVNHKH